ncbi:MAG: CPBP family intramembrane metalloprotease [Pontimonas sp.]|nr:CPBP family intramembrane metalloprotease [Pontimonas sp.]
MARARLVTEIFIVLGLSIGMSALYSIVNIAVRLSREQGLSTQTATLNRSASELEWADFLYHTLGVVSSLVPVALVVFLLWNTQKPHLGALGLDGRKLGRDSAAGVGLAALIGIPGLGLYLLGRELDITVTVVPTALTTYWWTIPMLIALALRAGLLEEIIAVGYLFARLRELGVSTWGIILIQSVLRASYHLYQGFGAFAGNFVMGLIFGWIYARTGRLAPLIIGHTVIDIVAFVGYPLAVSFMPEILGIVL